VVSVVIPLYNKGRHVKRTLESVLAQTCSDFEVVVVDDGSTDDGPRVVETISDPRIRLIRQANAGVSAARNRGIQEAKGDCIAFMDADDEWLPAFLETIVKLRSLYPEAGMYATAYRMCVGETVTRPVFVNCDVPREGGLLNDYFAACLGTPPVCASAVMIPKAVFDEVGVFPVGIRRGEDLHMWARVGLRYRVAWSPLDGAIYHLSADNRACRVDSVAEDVAVASPIEDFLRSGLEPVSSRHMVEEYLAYYRLMYAANYHLAGRTAMARNLLSKTQGTTMFRRKRLFLQFATRLPPSVCAFALALKERCRNAKSMLGAT
jgi:glycosyltransferase involved in cell wall biosynthesis